MATFTQTDQGTFLDKEPNQFTQKLKLATGIMVSTCVMAIVFMGVLATSVIAALVAGVTVLFKK